MPLRLRSVGAFRNRLRLLSRRLERSWVRACRSYNSEELADVLLDVGVQEGSCIMLHSAYDQRYGFLGAPSEAVDAFIRAVGDDGCLLMVALPYRSSTIRYLRSGRTYDVVRTPSAMGLISESFRNRTGVLHSGHPTHPVLGAGSPASWFLREHPRSLYPCGPDTPFGRLVASEAKIVFFNVSLDSMTFFHYLEHIVSPRLPFKLYGNAPMDVTFRDEKGQMSRMQTYVFSEEAISRRRPHVLHRWISERGLLRVAKIGASTVLVVEACKIANLVEEKAEQGEYFYEI